MLTSLRLSAAAAVLATIATVAAYQEHQKPSRPDVLDNREKVLWADPGDPSLLDFEHGIGGVEHQPQPPFRFISEDLTGTSRKVNVMDSRSATWNVKWGHEARSSAFCTRLVWACGYYAETEYFLAQGTIEGAHDLKRARNYIAPDGSFKNARFQLRSGGPKFLVGQSWAWTANPFLNTRELQGLKILMLLVSNWDAKDERDKKNIWSTNTNLSVFADDSAGTPRYIYADDDWGASMGKWGGVLTWSKWDCKGFANQTPEFLKKEKDGSLRWGFFGKHTKSLTRDITGSDIQWLLQYLGRITDQQLRTGLIASGASSEETQCFTKALRRRIDMLKEVAR